MRRRPGAVAAAAAVLAAAAMTAAAALGCGAAADSGGVPASNASASATAAAVTPRTVVDFVDEAVAYARGLGKEAALAAYDDPEGRFRRGELYVFAYDMKGTNLAHIDPALVGQDLIDLKDPEGTPIIRRFVEIARKGGGWFTYVWPNPVHGDRPEPKLAYITRVGSDWLLGAGMYLPVVGRALASPSASPSAALTESEVVAFVERAAAYVRAHGRAAALEEFSDPDGQFTHGDQYVFAEDFQGNELANGGQPELVGTNLMDATDPNGVKILEVLIAAARKGRGWAGYTWDNPATGEQQAKRAYVIKVGSDWYVGSGMYVR